MQLRFWGILGGVKVRITIDGTSSHYQGLGQGLGGLGLLGYGVGICYR